MILNLGGKTFDLQGPPKLGLLVDLEKKGIDMMKERGPNEPVKFTVEQVMNLVHQVLLSCDPEVKEEWVRDVVTTENMKEVVEIVGSFFSGKELKT